MILFGIKIWPDDSIFKSRVSVKEWEEGDDVGKMMAMRSDALRIDYNS